MADRRRREEEEIVYGSASDYTEKHEESEYKPTSFKVPDGMSVFRFTKAKLYEIDIIPYKVGKGNPHQVQGKFWWERTYYTHRIGVDDRHHTCPRRFSGGRCPVCEEYTRKRMNMSPNASKEEFKALSEIRDKERQLFLVIDRDETDKGVQLMECAHYLSFGELMKNKISVLKEGDKRLKFFALKGGYTLQIKVNQGSYNGRPSFKAANIEFTERDEDYPTSLLKEIPCLDDLIIVKSYDKLKEIFTKGEASEDQEESEEIVDDTDDVEESENEEYSFDVEDRVTFEYRGKTYAGEIIKINADKGIATVQDDKDKMHAVRLSDLQPEIEEEEEPEEEVEEEPAPRRRGKKQVEEEPEEEEIEEEEEDFGFKDSEEEIEEEEEPAPKRRGPKPGRRR